MAGARNEPKEFCGKGCEKKRMKKGLVEEEEGGWGTHPAQGVLWADSRRKKECERSLQWQREK